MPVLHYQPIALEYARRIRATQHDDFGHPIEISTAGEHGYGPCRCCLRQFRPGEQRILFSYAPVGADHAYNEVGPVFIHAEECTPYAADAADFPPEIKAGRLPIPLVLRKYSAARRMVGAMQVADNAAVETLLEQIFEDPAVAFVHVRNAEVQCFITQVARRAGEN